METEQTFESGIEYVLGIDTRSILKCQAADPRHLAALAAV